MHNRYVLDFEEPLKQIREKILEMEDWSQHDQDNAKSELQRLEDQEQRLSKEIYSSLTNWQRVQIARHPKRPYMLDYIEMMTTEFTELHGDRYAGDDQSMITGFAKIEGVPIAVVGQQKGRDNESRIARNFGMPNPEGYRKALRVMKLAEKFKRPILTFIDTPGAFPGILAEERGQGEAIARNLMEMSLLKVPVIVIVIGEGGSGGALGIGIGDSVIILENSFYSVIAPESCATILLRSTEKKDVLSDALKLSATDLKKLNIVDTIIPEPTGGAHNDPKAVAKKLKNEISKLIKDLKNRPTDQLVKDRIKKFRDIGRWSE